jgi:hypothetical protein
MPTAAMIGRDEMPRPVSQGLGWRCIHRICFRNPCNLRFHDSCETDTLVWYMPTAEVHAHRCADQQGREAQGSQPQTWEGFGVETYPLHLFPDPLQPSFPRFSRHRDTLVRYMPTAEVHAHRRGTCPPLCLLAGPRSPWPSAPDLGLDQDMIDLLDLFRPEKLSREGAEGGLRITRLPRSGETQSRPGKSTALRGDFGV